MREVEIKVRLRESTVQFLARVIGAGASFSAEVEQIDEILVPRPRQLREVDARHTPILRLRTSGQRTTLTLKRDVADQLDSVEHEVDVLPEHEMRSILDELGYWVVVTVRKVRRNGRLGTYTLCVDEVEGLGAFVECEAVVDSEIDDEGAAALRLSMWEVLEGLGLSSSDAVLQGYDRMVADRDQHPHTEEA